MTLPPKDEAADIGLAWIPMADGVRLSARIWRPAGLQPAPVVLEYIPYRKSDAYRAHDDAWGAALAAEGFAYARVDVRGSGDSEGVLVDEYLESEIEDGCAVIAWLAAQPWCSGAVGMCPCSATSRTGDSIWPGCVSRRKACAWRSTPTCSCPAR